MPNIDREPFLDTAPASDSARVFLEKVRMMTKDQAAKSKRLAIGPQGPCLKGP